MHDPHQTLPADVIGQLNALRVRLAKCLRDGRAVNLATWLEELPASARDSAMRMLLAEEIALRKAADETPTLAEYLTRFPRHEDLVREVFSAGVEAASDNDHSTAEFNRADVETANYIPRKKPLRTEGLQLPCNFGGYELLEQLGKGGMGVVFRARQRSANRIVALKLIRPDQLSQYLPEQRQQVLARFRNEVEAAARLEHDHVVRVYEVGEIEGQSYYTMQLIEGESLSDVLKDGPLEPTDAARYIEQVAQGLAAAHAIGILHRDLKPHNVMIDRNTDRALLADFGLAKLESDDHELTVAHAGMGSPPWMAPEQFDDAKNVTAVADVYGLGATLYHLLTGRPPFQGANPTATRKLVQTTEVVSPRELNNTIPLDLDTICLKCLEKEPSNRYASAEILAERLDRIQRGEPIPERPIGRVEKSWRWCKRNPVVSGLTAAVAGVLLIGIITTSYFAITSRNFASGLETANTKITKQAENLKTTNADLTNAVDRANSQADLAQKRGDDLAKQLKRAEDARHAILWNGAQRAFHQNDIVEAERLLFEVSPRYQNDWVTLHLGAICERRAKTLRGHTEAVYAVAYSPDGRTIASASWDKTIKLWDVASGQETLTLKGHNDAVYGLAFSPDGRIVASVSEDMTLKTWEVESGEEEFTLRGHTAPVVSVAFSPDGQTIASASEDKTIRLWEVATGDEQFILRGHIESVSSVAFSPDGRMVASASEDNTLKLWNAEDGMERLTLNGHKNRVLAVAYSADGRNIVSGSADNKLKLWDAKNGHEKFTFEGHSEEVLSVAYCPDGSTIASASADKTIKLWDTESGQEKDTFRGHMNWVHGVAYSPDGSNIVSASHDATLKLWNVEIGHENATFKGHTDGVLCVAHSPKERTLASASKDKSLKIWELKGGEAKLTLNDHADWVCALAYSPLGDVLASASWDKTIKLWDAENGLENFTLRGHASYVTSVTFSPDGRTVASASGDKTVRLWDSENGYEKRLLEGHTGTVRSVAYSPDGRTIASASDDSTLKLWDAENGQEKCSLEGHTGKVFSVTFSPNGRTIASASWDRTLRLWDAESGEEKLTLKGHTGRIFSVCFAPDGRTVASASEDTTFRLWDVESGQEKFAIQGHETEVRGVAFSPDGRSIFSASLDGSMKRWDAPTYQLQVDEIAVAGEMSECHE